MSLELKKITWTSFKTENHFSSKEFHRKGMISLSGSFCKLQHPLYFAIENFITKHSKIYFDPNLFYLYMDNKRIKNTFTSIDEAKEFAQKSLEELIIKTLFETPPRRKVIVEKCKFQESKTRPKKKNPNTEFIPKAEVIDLRSSYKREMSQWSKHKQKRINWDILNYEMQSVLTQAEIINNQLQNILITTEIPNIDEQLPF